jgi:hypothetical protein
MDAILQVIATIAEDTTKELRADMDALASEVVRLESELEALKGERQERAAAQRVRLVG